MPIVEVKMLTGRKPEQKRFFVREVLSDRRARTTSTHGGSK